MRNRKSWPAWTFCEPSKTCETVRGGVQCGKRAWWAYPTMGGGYHAMCLRHARKHLSYSVAIEDARQGCLPRLTTAFMRPR